MPSSARGLVPWCAVAFTGIFRTYTHQTTTGVQHSVHSMTRALAVRLHAYSRIFIYWGEVGVGVHHMKSQRVSVLYDAICDAVMLVAVALLQLQPTNTKTRAPIRPLGLLQRDRMRRFMCAHSLLNCARVIYDNRSFEKKRKEQANNNIHSTWCDHVGRE